MRAALIVLLLIGFASPAPAQIRLFTDGQIIKLGPTKAERRARQMGVMLGAMSGRQPAPDPNHPQGRPAPAPDQGAVPGR
jgi:hypothetical protein